ncbi:MAG: asparagine--tRNA ligase [Candidatus Lambdaproteobacteria bacterium]|nr:asparagine--tRNA ligase [Candidatus Lambdaproteobacteria bacterium]
MAEPAAPCDLPGASPGASPRATADAPPGALPRTPIRALLREGKAGERARIEGWVRTRRESKEVAFIEVNDGSALASLQVVVERAGPLAVAADRAATGSSLVAEGTLVPSPGKGQAVELRAEALTLVQAAPADFPLQKKRHSFEYLRTIAHLRVRSNTFGALARVRNAVFAAVHAFFQRRGFLFLPAPIITASDAEGAGAMFRVTTLDPAHPPLAGELVDWSRDFFGQKANLTVSGQLEAEVFALAFHDVYTFGPTFRAEHSNTARHAAEFWMIEPEMAFADLAANIRLAEAFIRHVIEAARAACPEDFAFFDRWVEQGLLARLDHVLDSRFEVIPYGEAIRLLEVSGQPFEYPVSWGLDLQSEHERYLTEQAIGRPVFVTDYPRSIKAFYMRENADGRTVAAMDLLVPGVGEIIGGSQREERLEKLAARMAEAGIPAAPYDWYLDLRRHGSVAHAGFGVGFERLLMYLTGLQNIRDVIPFPRTPGNVAF